MVVFLDLNLLVFASSNGNINRSAGNLMYSYLFLKMCWFLNQVANIHCCPFTSWEATTLHYYIDILIFSSANELFPRALILTFSPGRSSRAKKKWRERDECVRANFEQYKLDSNYLDVLISDASKHSLWAIDGIFDAIITDRKWVLQ